MTVNRSLVAAGDDSGSQYFGNLDSAFFSARPRRHTSLDATERSGPMYRARSASNVLDSTDDFHKRLYDPAFAPHLQRPPTRKQDGLAELVDFLKNQAPPSNNFMSIPDEGTDDERGRWLKWAKLAKRSKSQPRGPPQIMLPDTAVSGTTIGGHRHIAITIPFEALPMGEKPRSQYPVYGQGLGSERPSTSPVRTVVNDKGVVTVLKTVNEDREGSTSSLHRAPSSSYSHAGSLPASRTSSRGGRQGIHGFFTAPPSRGATSNHNDDASRARQVAPPSNAYPARGSSMMNRSLHQHISIDGMLSQPGTAGRAPAKEEDSQTGAQGGAKDEAPIKQKKSVKLKPAPIAVNGTPVEKANDENVEDEDAQPTSAAAMSRKDRVRDRKRRDIEALKIAKQKQEQAGEQISEPKYQLSPIRVVVNWEPDQPTAELPLTPSQTDSSQPSATKEEFTTLPSPMASLHPTPPRSPLTPGKKPANLDRTSLSRRREWKATREQERKSKESRAAVRQRARELAAGRHDDIDDSPQTLDKEILRLYEAYREHRFRDMERRVRRLERNGDVWLRALVPVLDNLNHNIAAEGLNDRAYMSDGEPAQKNRTTVPLRRANSSHKTLREEEVEHRNGDEDADCDSDGLDTIEPLMRELAGAARARQMKKNAGLLRAC